MARRLVSPIVVLLLLGLAGGMQVLIDLSPERREALAERPFEDLPPDKVIVDYIASQSLGSFRSLVVSALWQRADRLKEEEQFDELLGTTEMLCRLQPHLAEAWEFNAYNMAFNISWQQEEREHRWTWLDEGLRLYDEGLRRNPRSSFLMERLGYTYWHRVPQEEYLIRRVLETRGEESYRLAERWLELSRKLKMDEAREAGRPFDYLINNKGFVVDSRYSLGLVYLRRAAKHARLGEAAEARKNLSLARTWCLAASDLSFEVSMFAPDPTFWRNRAHLYRDLARTRTILSPCLLDLAETWIERLLVAPTSPEARWPEEMFDCVRRVTRRWKELSTTPVQIFAMQVVADSLRDVFAAWEGGNEAEAMRLLDERGAFCEAFNPQESGWRELARGVRGLKEMLAKRKEAAEAEKRGDKTAAGIAREEARRNLSLFIETNLRLDTDWMRDLLR